MQTLLCKIFGEYAPFTFIPNNKILHWSTLKACAKVQLYVARMMRYASARAENIVEYKPITR